METNNNANDAGRLLSYIEYSQREPHQIATYRGLPSFPTCKFQRPPLTINELLLGQCGEGVVLWMDAYKTLLLINLQTISPKVTYTKYFAMRFHFDDEKEVSVQAYGDSVDSILKAALFFGQLQLAENTEMILLSVYFSDSMTFEDVHEEQLASLFDAIPTKNISFSHRSQLDSVLSKVLATRPYPIQLTLEKGVTMDVAVFLDHLSVRLASDALTTFGSLFWETVLLRKETWNGCSRTCPYFRASKSDACGMISFHGF